MLYLFEGRPEERTHFYAREQQHIIDLVNHYRSRLTPEQWSNPEIHTWVKKEPTIDSIVQVEQGQILFVGGPIFMGGEGDLFDVRLNVTSDFVVALPKESLPSFEIWRSDILNKRRGVLYQAHVPHALFGGQYFIPEDVARAIVGYDLSRVVKKSRNTLKRLEGLKHPNLRITTMKDARRVSK